MKKKFSITGMSCSACSARVEKAVKEMDGVINVSVNLLTGTMTAEYDINKLTAENIIKRVTDEGFGAAEYVFENKVKERNVQQLKGIKNRFISSAIFLVILMIFSMQHMVGYPLPSIFDSSAVMALTQLILTLPIIIINRNYFINGFKNIIKLAPNMDSLIAVGASASFIYSVYITGVFIVNSGASLHNEFHLYYESAAMILTLITMGKLLETLSKNRTSDAVQKLMYMTPKKATVIIDGEEAVIDADLIEVGMTVIAKPGEQIAVDGVIIEGASTIDQSAVTGESIPVEKAVGDKVISATINQNGYIKYRAVRVGDDTTFAQIIRLVEEAGGSKAPIARLADKISLWFVPCVMLISAITFIVWALLEKGFAFSLNMAISVLVISCPCALGLATPVAIMVGTGVAAKNGILVKSALSLEALHKINAVILDKTGTVTVGKPAVKIIIPYIDRNELLCYAYTIEKMSQHPLANAIIKYCQDAGVISFEAKDFKSVSGRGIGCFINNNEFIGGNAAFMQENGIDTKKAENDIKSVADSGATPMIFAKNKEIIGIIGVADDVKDDSIDAINELKRLGIKVVMLTGDSRRVAEIIAERTGINEVEAEVMPEDKERAVRRLQEGGMKVAMIGDGINDAAALARADVGIAIGAGTDIAIESADIVLIKSKLYDAVTAIRLGKVVIRNIKMSLFWAFFYNTMGIPLAAGALFKIGITLNPMIAAAAMSFSSVCVVLNALRLKRFK